MTCWSVVLFFVHTNLQAYTTVLPARVSLVPMFVGAVLSVQINMVLDELETFPL